MGHADLVSVLVPAYNHERYVGECIQALAAQTHGPLELLIADDASTDGTVAAIERALAGHPDRVSAYRAGRTGLLGFFVGQVMAGTGGRANPERVKTLLRERLD